MPDFASKACSGHPVVVWRLSMDRPAPLARDPNRRRRRERETALLVQDPGVVHLVRGPVPG